MHKFTQISNGYTLTIELEDENLIAELDEDIQDMECAIADGITKEDTDTMYDLYMEKVYGEPGEFCTFDEVIADRNEFKETIQKLITDNGETLWAMAELKKNGTFKKNCKPIIRQAINGSYWEDSYGWNTLVMRLVPITDTLARVELDMVVLHY